MWLSFTITLPAMYLKKLYHTNKWWFALVLLFIVVQLTMDAKQGIDISPVYHYGMYSGVITPQKEYRVTEITVNGKQLQTKNFSPYEWDKIIEPVELFENQQAWNTQIWNTEVKRLLHFADSSKYVNNLSDGNFVTWYNNYLKTILHKRVDSVNIEAAAYTFDGHVLIKKPTNP